MDYRGKNNAFKPYEGDFEAPDDVNDKDKGEVISPINSPI
jgi:hypothetical protein